MNNKKSTNLDLPQEWPGAHYYDHQEEEAVARVARSGSPFRFYGPDLQGEVDKFETEFADFIGVDHCLGVSSGTAALQVALASMGVGPGDEVLLPGYFWVSIVSAVVRSGAIPKLVDVDASFSLDPDDLERKISENSKVVLMVHMGGVIGDVSRVVDICTRHGLLLLEDCAQAGGAQQAGRKAGSFGHMAIFSFQLNKNFTSGEGGAVVTNSQEMYNRAFAIHDLGYYRREDGRLEFDDPAYQLWGIGCRMNEFVAAVLRVQLKKLDGILTSMREMKHQLTGLLSGFNGLAIRQIADPDGEGGGFLKIIFDEQETSHLFLQGLKDHGISVKEGGMNPVHMTEWGLHIYYNVASLVNKKSICGHHSVWESEANRWAADYEYGKGSCPVLDSYVERTVIFCIPSKLSEEQRTMILGAFELTCKELKLKKAK
jgi:dTDP-4-amino-4,6-dideoxygalactose transaminase